MKQKDIIGIAVAVVLALGTGYLIYLISIPNTPPDAKDLDPMKAAQSAGVASDAQVAIRDISIGTGETAQNGDTLTINYIGKLQDGTKFDSSYDRNQTFGFVLGEHKVIPGMEMGVQGMKVGGKREVTIPPELAYGDKQVGEVIAPNSTLVFTIELLDVKHPAQGN